MFFALARVWCVNKIQHNIKLQDSRFDDEVDRIMGYYTSSLLCMPVKNSYEEIIAVAQVNNKNPDKDDGHFTSMDEKVRRTRGVL